MALGDGIQARVLGVTYVEGKEKKDPKTKKTVHEVTAATKQCVEDIVDGMLEARNTGDWRYMNQLQLFMSRLIEMASTRADNETIAYASNAWNSAIQAQQVVFQVITGGMRMNPQAKKN